MILPAAEKGLPQKHRSTENILPAADWGWPADNADVADDLSFFSA
jgi:hypothetical protein